MKSSYIQLITSFILFATVWLGLRHISDISGIMGLRQISDIPITQTEQYNAMDAVSSNNKFCKIYDLYQPISEKFNCIVMKIKPHPRICIYPPKEDKYISGRLSRNGAYDPEGVMLIQDILSKDSELGFIDIGANIGTYTLTMAKMNRKVVAVEPLSENVKRLHKAAQLSNIVGNIILVNNAVSNIRTKVTLQLSTDNQGATKIEEQSKNIRDEAQSKSSENITTILLDDLLQVIPFKKAAMKIDVEGHEHKAFSKAYELLTAIDISYIYMEWLFMRKYQQPESEDFVLVQKVLEMFQEKGFEPYRITLKKVKTSKDTGSKKPVWNFPGGNSLIPYVVDTVKLKPESWKKWPQNILWAKKKPVLSNH